jgi:hypothetical protein
MRNLSKFMTDGKISLDQIKAFGQAFRGWHGPKGAGPKAP